MVLQLDNCCHTRICPSACPVLWLGPSKGSNDDINEFLDVRLLIGELMLALEENFV